MRAASNNRYGLWAPILAMHPRIPGADFQELRDLEANAIRKLIADGYLYLFRSPKAWGFEEVVDDAETSASLADDRNWRPRRINSRKLVRLGVTARGVEAFLAGEFGEPAPMLLPTSSGYELLELQPYTAREAVMLLLGLIGFGVGAFAGALLGDLLIASRSFRERGATEWSEANFIGVFVGGIVGLGLTIAIYKKARPDEFERTELDPQVIPDQYMDGPSLNPYDDVGNPRF